MTAIAKSRAQTHSAVITHVLCTLSAPAAHHPSFSPELIEGLLRATLETAEEQVVGIHAHRFEPQGFTLTVFGERCQVVLHTWPERALATLDVRAPRDELARVVLQAMGRELEWTCVETERLERVVG